MNTEINNYRGSISGYARANNLTATERAIGYVEHALEKYCEGELREEKKESLTLHVYEVCSMIIDLELGITIEEEDKLLAAVLLHVLPENWPIENLYEKIVNQLGYDEETYNIVNLMATRGEMTSEEQKELCERIQSDKLALIAELVDRGCIIQGLHQNSTWVAHSYIAETKALYLPMAIYGKEHYRELMGAISILTERLKIFLEVAEVFLKKFELREAELQQDILALYEENATVRGIISDFKAGRNE